MLNGVSGDVDPVLVGILIVGGVLVLWLLFLPRR